MRKLIFLFPQPYGLLLDVILSPLLSVFKFDFILVTKHFLAELIDFIMQVNVLFSFIERFFQQEIL